jgi:hypothetical protein
MSSYDEISMTPDQFFDELDTLFGNTDGYVPHLEEIKKLKEENDQRKKECFDRDGTTEDFSNELDKVFGMRVADQDDGHVKHLDKINGLLGAIQEMYDYVERIGDNERICVETILAEHNVTNYEKTEEEPVKDICCQCPDGSCGECESYRDMIKAIDEDGDEILFAPRCLADNGDPDYYNICLDCDVYHHECVSSGPHLVHGVSLTWCLGCWNLKTKEELDKIVGPAV